jgi:putative endonuclease
VQTGLGAQSQSGPRFQREIWSRQARLVEAHETLENAFRREKQMKGWKRNWKIQLIETDNPHWIDLYPSLSP